MRRLPRVSARVSAAVAVAAVCVAVAVLAATGTFGGGAGNARLTAEQRAHNALLAHLKVEQRAALRAAKKAARERAEGPGPRPWKPHSNYPVDRDSRAVGIAEKYLGEPYVWGGASPKQGFDSSGLVMYVYSRVGISLPHYSAAQYHYRNAVSVRRSQLEPGDLVFFYGLGHVGIYIGGNQFIHSPHTGTVVRIESLTGAYSKHYDGATRILS
jgi:cell wall-associated NlpC family hydrolase